MDYAHAQRVLSDSLLRRSFTVSYADKLGRPSLLRYENIATDASGNALPTIARVGPPAVESPVVGVGIGKTSDGGDSIVLLTETPKQDFDSNKLVASIAMSGLKVEEIRGGRVVSTARPAQGGESLGHSNGDTGTFGCLVKDSTNALFLLSCNHVIAALNQGKKGVDEVWQPGQVDGGRAKAASGYYRISPTSPPADTRATASMRHSANPTRSKM